jgi:hypothetical protein
VPKTLGLIYFSGLFRNQSSIKELDLLDKIGEGFFMVKKEKKSRDGSSFSKNYTI